MTAIQTLTMIASEVSQQLAKVNQLTLTDWCSLADTLGVARNDRRHAAKKLALRKLRASGLLA
jgi:hypothetical protein